MPGSLPAPAKFTHPLGPIVISANGLLITPVGGRIPDARLPNTFISAAFVHGLLLTSVSALKRMKRPAVAGKTTSFSRASLAKVPEAAGLPQFVPSMLT